MREGHTGPQTDMKTVRTCPSTAPSDGSQILGQHPLFNGDFKVIQKTVEGMGKLC